MKKVLIIIFFVLGLFLLSGRVAFINSADVTEVGCGQDCDSTHVCKNDAGAGTAWCDSSGKCRCTTGGGGDQSCAGGYYDWSDCVGSGTCYQTHWCKNPTYLYQIRQCTCPVPTDPPCNPGQTTCGACSVSCGAGTRSCNNGCDSWSENCNNGDCATPVPPTATPTPSNAPGKPTIITSCVNNTPTANISWTGSPNPTYGFWVDISEFSSFSAYYNKNVTSGNTTDSTGFKGLVPAQDQILALQTGKTYYSRVFNGATSVNSDGFTVNPCTATPTTNPNCLCASNACSADCPFDYNIQITSYIKPPKCNLSSSLFPTPPTDSDKNGWCKNLRTKGDADGNGIVDKFDYYYYVAVVSGGKIPAKVNPDFSGDGEIGRADLDIYKLTMNIP